MPNSVRYDFEKQKGFLKRRKTPGGNHRRVPFFYQNADKSGRKLIVFFRCARCWWKSRPFFADAELWRSFLNHPLECKTTAAPFCVFKKLCGKQVIERKRKQTAGNNASSAASGK
jgi:hypothetical protein